MPATMILVGDKKAQAKLSRLEKKIATKYVKDSAKVGLKTLLPRVKAAAPRKTGLLAASFKVRVIKQKGKRQKDVGAEITNANPGKKFAGRLARHAILIERGTKPRYHKSEKFTGRGPETRFVLRAVNPRRQATALIYRRDLRRRIRAGAKVG